MERIQFLQNHLDAIDCQIYGDETVSTIYHQFEVEYSAKLIFATLKLNGYTQKRMEKIAAEQDEEERAVDIDCDRQILEEYIPQICLFLWTKTI